MANVGEITVDLPPDYGANNANNPSVSSIPTITGQYPQPSAYPPALYPAPYGYPPQSMSVGGPGGYYPPPQPQQQPIIVMQQMQQQQQQQQTTVIVNAGYIDIYRSQKILACFVVWLCNCPFGLTAWILAMVASSTHDSDPDSARRLGKASLGVSISGVIVSVIVVSVVLGVCLSATSSYYSSPSSSCSGYKVSGTCYSSRRYVYYTCSSYSYYTFNNCCHTSTEDTYDSYYCYTL